MNTLALRNVSYRYEGSDKTIFRDVNLQFEAGKVYTIVGKSGAGKSTLLSLLSGLDTATSGQVNFGGKNLSEIDRDHYRSQKAGIIFQSLNLLVGATAIDNIVLSMNISQDAWASSKRSLRPAGIKGIDKKARAYELLEKVGISKEKAHRKILKLSGGEQQRVGIARALAHDPMLIIADEPTGSLDKDTEATVLEIFQSLAHDEGKCVIIVTHSENVTAVADEVWSLEEGNFSRG